MAMTPLETIDHCEEMVELFGTGIEAAQASSKYTLAASNSRQVFKCRFLQGLISWRLGRDPSQFMLQAVTEFAENLSVVQSIGGDSAHLKDVTIELVGFAALLADQPWSIDFTGDGLGADRLLDWVLEVWMFDSLNEALWDQGMTGTRKVGSRLAVDTYDLYHSIMTAPSSDLPKLVRRGEDLFEKREQDSYFAGGDQLEGGSTNEIVVDFRMGALLKYRGYQGDSMHVWRW